MQVDWENPASVADAEKFRQQKCPAYVDADPPKDENLLRNLERAKDELVSQIERLKTELDQPSGRSSSSSAELRRGPSQKRPGVRSMREIGESTKKISDVARELRQRHDAGGGGGEADSGSCGGGGGENDRLVGKKVPFDPKSHQKDPKPYPLLGTSDVELGSLGVGECQCSAGEVPARCRCGAGASAAAPPIHC